MTDLELEMMAKDYYLWLNLEEEKREEWLINLNNTEDYISQLNKECEILRRGKYPTQEETIDAIVNEDSSKLDEIRTIRKEVDQKYPRVSLD